MKIEKQGPYECLLATLAALSDTSLDDMRNLACKIAHVEQWRDTLKFSNASWWAIAKEVAAQTGFSHLIEQASKHSRQTPVSGTQLSSFQGRGIIIISKAKISHIMPFENGVIYDSEHPDTPYKSLAQMKKTYKYWKIRLIEKL